MNKQREPVVVPADLDAWAQGLKPVPPGPGNPLGTRWMGICTPGRRHPRHAATTLDRLQRSHGCVRMHVPDAEWLFEHVAVGTPVVIL